MNSFLRFLTALIWILGGIALSSYWWVQVLYKCKDPGICHMGEGFAMLGIVLLAFVAWAFFTCAVGIVYLVRSKLRQSVPWWPYVLIPCIPAVLILVGLVVAFILGVLANTR